MTFLSLSLSTGAGAESLFVQAKVEDRLGLENRSTSSCACGCRLCWSIRGTSWYSLNWSISVCWWDDIIGSGKLYNKHTFKFETRSLSAACSAAGRFPWFDLSQIESRDLILLSVPHHSSLLTTILHIPLSHKKWAFWFKIVKIWSIFVQKIAIAHRWKAYFTPVTIIWRLEVVKRVFVMILWQKALK